VVPQSAVEQFLAGSSFVHSFLCTPGGTVLSVNDAVTRQLRVPAAELVGASLWGYLSGRSRDVLEEQLTVGAGSPERFLLHLRGAPDVLYTLSCLLAPAPEGFLLLGEPTLARLQAFTEEMIELNGELTALSRESTKQKVRLARALAELETSYWHIRRIQEVLPICMNCNRVKTETSRWEDVAEYLKRNSLFLSHGYCPPCSAAVLASYGLEPDSP